MAAEQRHLVLMARRPILGQGKRRLAAEIGDAAAHRFQLFAIETLLGALGHDQRWRLWLAITPDRPLSYPGAAFVLGQGSGDLGARLTRVSRRLPPGPIAFIGSDAPEIVKADIAAAFVALARADAVIGPAPDGGYWLIGFSHAQRRRLPFRGVRWSTPHARSDTLANLAGRRVAFLRQLEDVDDGASYRRVMKNREHCERRVDTHEAKASALHTSARRNPRSL